MAGKARPAEEDEMSLNALEKALWQAYQVHADTARLKSDPAAYAAGFNLTAQEAKMLGEVDVMGLINHGANPLLVMMVWQSVNGMAEFHKYYEAVNGAAAA
ncbi:MAG TPA: hypothetical protein PKE25_14445 [Novosphingobium sp.]|nr:hypothetical protein [Novosphingobium sp.]